jgi:hypothetical protein
MSYYYPNGFKPIPSSNIQLAHPVWQQNRFYQAPIQPLQLHGYPPRVFLPSRMAPKQATQPPGKHLAQAVGLFAVGLLLHRLPASKSSFSLISSDWKDWARMTLGVFAAGEVNRSLDWHPKPWQLALETVTILSPLSNGLLNQKAWRQFPLLAIFVPLLVQSTDWLNQWAQHKLDDTHSHLPHWVPKLVISISATLAGLLTLRSLVKTNAYRQLTGQSESVHASQVIGPEAIICTRCGGQHLLCMSELGDMAGSLGAWFKGPSQQKESS